MAGNQDSKAKVKLVSVSAAGAIFVVAFASGIIEIRDCEGEDPERVRASIAVRPDVASTLAAALNEAAALASG